MYFMRTYRKLAEFVERIIATNFKSVNRSLRDTEKLTGIKKIYFIHGNIIGFIFNQYLFDLYIHSISCINICNSSHVKQCRQSLHFGLPLSRLLHVSHSFFL